MLRLLEGIVDVYLPDLKYADDEAGYLYSKVSGYKEYSRAGTCVRCIRQTGDELVFDEDGLLKRGLLIRLLVLPNDIGGISESLEWIRDELSPRVAISLMAQYYPTHQAETNKRYVLAVATDPRIGMAEGDRTRSRVGNGRRLGAGV